MIQNYFADRPDIDFPSFPAWFEHGVAAWKDRTALRYRRVGEPRFSEWTYGDLDRRVRRLAGFLASRGLKAGDRVALWSENRLEWCAGWLSAVLGGFVVVPIDVVAGAAEACNIVNMAGAVAWMVSLKRAADSDLAAACPGVATFLSFDDEGPRGEKWFSFSGIQADASVPPMASFPRIPPEGPASIIFTSGTTGMAKGVTLSHHGIIANVNASIMSLPIYDWDVFMSVLPLHHTYPTTCAFISPLSVGASVTLCEKLVGKVILDDARDSGGTILIAVPLLYDKVMNALEHGFKSQKQPVRSLLRALMAVSRFMIRTFDARWFGKAFLKGIRKKAGLSTLRLLVAGGGPLNPKTGSFFEMLGFCIVQGYGMSENGPLITTNTMKYRDNESVGLVVKYTQLKILNPNEEGVGEIAVKSPSLMLGYFGNPEATAQVFTEDGWLKTGDMGRVDGKGFVHITGRIKSILVSGGGKNIYPEEIEQRFEGSRTILELLVVGRRKPGSLADEIVAVAVPHLEALAQDNPGVELTDAFLLSKIKDEVYAVNRQLPSYKKVMDVLLRREEFEKTSSKKIRRYLYKDLANPN